MNNECGHCEHEKVCIHRDNFISLKKDTQLVNNVSDVFIVSYKCKYYKEAEPTLKRSGASFVAC